MKQMKIFYLFCSLIISNQYLYSGMPMQPNVDNLDMQQIQQELEEANRAIEEYIATLSPDEQDEFNRSVDQLSQMFEEMSEEELLSFLNEMFSEEPMPDFDSAPASMPEEILQETSVMTSAQKSQIDTIITVINDIIRQSNIVLVQINSSIDLAYSIDKWGNRGEIKNWQPETDWSDLQRKIERFVQKLYKIQEKNPSTQEYRYFTDLIADESTLNNLIQLQNNLNASVPKIEVSEFDIQGISEKSKTALINTLEYYLEALYLLEIPQALDILIEKYDPTAKQIREAEEAATKKASDIAKRPRTPVASTSAGHAAEEGYSDFGGYGSSYYDSGYNSYGSPYDSYYGGGYGGDGSDYSGDYGNNYEQGGRSGGSRGTSGGGSMGGAQDTTLTKDLKNTPQATDQVMLDPRSAAFSETIRDRFKTITDLIKGQHLLTMQDHIVDRSAEVDVNLANTIVTLNNELTKLIVKIDSFKAHLDLKNKSTQQYYKESFSVTIEEPLEILKQLFDIIDTIEKNYQSNKSKKLISPAKQWAYFKEKDTVLNQITSDESNGDDIRQMLQQNAKTNGRVSLFELRDTLKQCITAMNSIRIPSKEAVTSTTITPNMNNKNSKIVGSTTKNQQSQKTEELLQNKMPEEEEKEEEKKLEIPIANNANE